MLGSLRREHLAAVGFPEAYYLTSEQKIAVVNALTDEQRDLITRDFLVKALHPTSVSTKRGSNC